MLAAFIRIWQAGVYPTRAWLWFWGAVATLTAGFHYRVLPASQIVTAQGSLTAIVPIALGLLFAAFVAATFWLTLNPLESPRLVFDRTLLSLLLASLLCVCACIGPIGGTFYAHGRFVRLALWFVSFAALQLAWMLKWDQHWRARLPAIWKARDLISWTDAILAATVAVFAVEMSVYFDRPYIQITPFALVLNIGLLASAMVVTWALLGRGLLAAMLTIIGYAGLGFANAMKLKHLNIGLQIGDESYLSELLYFKEFFEPGPLAILGVVTVALLGLIAWAWWNSTQRLSFSTRARMLLSGALAFVVFAGIPWLPGSKPALLHLGIIEEMWDSIMSVKRNGMLVELAMQLPESYVPTPAGYSQAEVARIIAQQASSAATHTIPPVFNADAPPSLIVFFFEALINPHDFGRPLTRDPIPNFTALQAAGPHGYAISPRFANGSAESEFELLTGISTGFLPANSCAYKHFLKRSTPNLATMLRQHGDYHSTAVKCVTPGFYNFQEAYQHLQFDRFCYDEKFLAPTFDKFSGHLSDDSFVDEMLRPLSQPPCFVVGENLGSHAPFHAHMMGDKPRFLVEPSSPASDQIETYLQAISRVDDALGRMLTDLRQRPERVVMLVVGDHHPPLAADSHAYDTPAFTTAVPSGELFRHRVPYAVWKNFETVPEKSTVQAELTPTGDVSYVSMNFLALIQLRVAGIPPQGLLAWNQQLFEQCPVVSRDLFYNQGQAKSWDQLSPDLQRLIREYQLLQYDILLGNNYAAEIW